MTHRSLNRRQFSAAVAALGVSSLTRGAEASVHVEKLQLSRNGWMPNNEHLPVVLYRRAFQPSGDAAATMEQTFGRNAWPAQWRNGVYSFHHFHSTAHEVLGFAAGRARLILGGDGGHEITVEAGDVVVLPTGTGHCRLEADPAFLVIGAYPAGQQWDICRSAPDAIATQRMLHLSFPQSDPVTGADGPLPTLWRL